MKYNWEFWAVPKVALEDAGLSIDEAILLGILATRMNGENRAWPSQQSLANDLHKSIRSVRYYCEHLENHGWIEIERGDGNRIQSYKITIPPDPAKSALCKRCQGTLQKPVKKANHSIYLKEHRKDPATEVAPDSKWTNQDLGEYLNSMVESNNRGNQIIAKYLGYKSVGVDLGTIRLENKGQAQAEIKRNIRAANALKSYSDDQLESVMGALAEHARFPWTLETAGKFISYDKRKLVEMLGRMK